MKCLVLLSALLCSSCADSNKNDSTTRVAAPSSPSIEPEDQSPPEPELRPKAVAPGRFETIQFPAEDGLLITADLYVAHDEDAPFITLFHQAGWSRGEYREIAPKLSAMGFNCMAVDQRSGGRVNKVENATAVQAVATKLPHEFLDALPDMRASLNLVRTRYPQAKRISWGSSYSAGLVLVLAGTEPQLQHATLAFSPGEYFARFGKSKTFVAEAASKIATPVFITSKQDEARKWKAIYEGIESPTKTSFVPTSKGNHGSRALWAQQADSDAYWSAVSGFLKTI